MTKKGDWENRKNKAAFLYYMLMIIFAFFMLLIIFGLIESDKIISWWQM